MAINSTPAADGRQTDRRAEKRQVICLPSPWPASRLGLAWLGGLIFSAMSCAAAVHTTPAGACADARASSSAAFSTENERFLSDGGITLGGCLYRPKGLGRFPVLVMVTGSGEIPSAADYYTGVHAQALAAKGIGAFAFNKRGVGNSEGAVTSSDFQQRAVDVAAAVRFVRSLPTTTKVGLWGVSQAGWVIPQALQPNDGVAFVILVSPAGVNPNDQMTFFIHNISVGLGYSSAQVARAEQVHRALVGYYGSGKGYSATQELVSGYRNEPWFESFRTNAFWKDRIGVGGRLMTPSELAQEWKRHPADFE